MKREWNTLTHTACVVHCEPIGCRAFGLQRECKKSGLTERRQRIWIIGEDREQKTRAFWSCTRYETKIAKRAQTMSKRTNGWQQRPEIEIKMKHRQGHKILNGRKKIAIIKCVQCKQNECTTISEHRVYNVWAPHRYVHVCTWLLLQSLSSSIWSHTNTCKQVAFVLMPNAQKTLYPVESFCAS